MDEIIDLDALVPRPVTIKFGDETVEIPPPKTSDILRLGSLGQKMGQTDKYSPDELDKLVTELTEQVYNCIPALKDKPLNTAQLIKLVAIISDMAMPPDAEALKARGITTDTPKAA